MSVFTNDVIEVIRNAYIEGGFLNISSVLPAKSVATSIRYGFEVADGDELLRFRIQGSFSAEGMWTTTDKLTTAEKDLRECVVHAYKLGGVKGAKAAVYRAKSLPGAPVAVIDEVPGAFRTHSQNSSWKMWIALSHSTGKIVDYEPEKADPMLPPSVTADEVKIVKKSSDLFAMSMSEDEIAHLLGNEFSAGGVAGMMAAFADDIVRGTLDITYIEHGCRVNIRRADQLVVMIRVNRTLGLRDREAAKRPLPLLDGFERRFAHEGRAAAIAAAGLDTLDEATYGKITTDLHRLDVTINSSLRWSLSFHVSVITTV